MPSTSRAAITGAIAIAKLREAVAAFESKTDAEVKARAHYNLGVALQYSTFYDDGIKEIEVAMGIKADEAYRTQIANIQVFKADDVKLQAQSGQ